MILIFSRPVKRILLKHSDYKSLELALLKLQELLFFKFLNHVHKSVTQICRVPKI